MGESSNVLGTSGNLVAQGTQLTFSPVCASQNLSGFDLGADVLAAKFTAGGNDLHIFRIVPHTGILESGVRARRP